MMTRLKEACFMTWACILNCGILLVLVVWDGWDYAAETAQAVCRFIWKKTRPADFPHGTRKGDL